MYIKSDHSDATSIFFFAHQDDEFGVMQQIVDEVSFGRRVLCFYLTDGGVKCKKRNLESLFALSRLGVSAANIFFLGEEMRIRDGDLMFSAALCRKRLYRILKNERYLSRVFVPAWEGGHPDHDMLHYLIVTIMHDLGAIEKVFQFSLYNSCGLPRPFFHVMKPLPSNGAVQNRTIPFGSRLKFVSICLCYRSQWASWIGLFPLVAFSYFIFGIQSLQGVNLARLNGRPHEGRLYYEARGFANWIDMRDAIYHLNAAQLK